jgi:hypothetical protein
MMSDAEHAYGTKVWVQLEWEQVDAMIVKELKNQIELAVHDMEAAKAGESWTHPEDVAYNVKLLPALFIVYAHWAGEEAADHLKQDLEYDRIDV